jgi:hypothetical protein
MHLQKYFASRFARGVLSLSLLITTNVALSDTVTLSPTLSGSARDGGTTAFPTTDGQFDSQQSSISIRKFQGTLQSETRAAFEFFLPASVMQAGTTINQVTLTVPVNSETLPSNDSITIHGAAGNGTLTLDSFEISNPVSESMIFAGLPVSSRTLYVPYYLQSFPGSGNNRVLLVFTVANWGTSLSWGSGATLTIDYTPPQGTPPTLSILAPTNNATFVAGQSISLQATSADAEDGSRDWAIQWSSNINGVLGSGGSVFANQLAVGTHVISATLTDTHGNTTVQTRNINVVAASNTPPVVTITSPANGATLNTGVTIHFLATANDTEQGSLNSSIQWWLNNVTFLGTSADLPTQLSAGFHTITARVSDSGGLTAEASIGVNVVTPPPPSGYCAANGTNAGMEWVGGVAMNGGGRTSGSNGGYADFTSTQITANKGANTITLTPGFSGGSYNEYWAVWVDLNRDLIFTADEMLTSGNSNAALSRSINIPNTVAPGTTRMRVAMRYGSTPAACGAFSYGEVEDYTVNVVEAPVPPPTASYCPSRGTTSTWEWIARTDIAGVARISNNNGGYADFTTSTAMNLARGANSIVLTPGFQSGSSYTERWTAWVDFNQDKNFTADELVFTGASSAAVSGTFNVPASALAGATRMRVQVKFGANATACETFPYGEVEDYKVLIP